MTWLKYAKVSRARFVLSDESALDIYPEEVLEYLPEEVQHVDLRSLPLPSRTFCWSNLSSLSISYCHNIIPMLSNPNFIPQLESFSLCVDNLDEEELLVVGTLIARSEHLRCLEFYSPELDYYPVPLQNLVGSIAQRSQRLKELKLVIFDEDIISPIIFWILQCTRLERLTLSAVSENDLIKSGSVSFFQRKNA